MNLQVLPQLAQWTPFVVILFAIVSGIIFQQRSIAYLERRIDDSNRRIEDRRVDMNQRFQDQRADLNQRFEDQRAEMHQRFEDFRAGMSQRFEQINQLCEQINERFASLEKLMESQFSRVYDRLDRLKGRASSGKAITGTMVGGMT